MGVPCCNNDSSYCSGGVRSCSNPTTASNTPSHASSGSSSARTENERTGTIATASSNRTNSNHHAVSYPNPDYHTNTYANSNRNANPHGNTNAVNTHASSCYVRISNTIRSYGNSHRGY